MAKDPNPVRINVTSTADTKGLEQAAKKTDELTESTKELTEAQKEQAQGSQAGSNPMSMPAHIMGPERTDEIERQAEASKNLADETKKVSDAVEDAAENVEDLGTKSKDTSGKLDGLIGLGRAQAAAQFAQYLGDAARDVRALGTELQASNVKGANLVNGLATGMETVSATVAGAAQGFAVGGPLGAAVGGFIGLLSGPLKNAINNTVNEFKALKESEDAAAQAARNLKAAKDQIATDNQRNGLFEFFERGRQAIANATAELERFIKVRDATAAADSAVRKAQTSGDTSFRGTASNLEAEFNERIARLENDINDARARADLAEQRAVKAELDAKSAEANGATTQADVDKLAAEAKEARAAAEQARANSEDIITIAQQQLRTVIAEKDQQVSQAFQDVGDEAAASGQRILDLVNSASQQGETLSAAQKSSVESLQQILADGTVVEAERVRFQTDLKTIITALGNQGAAAAEANNLFRQAVESMDSNTRAFAEITRNMLRRQEELEAVVRELQEQAKNPPQPR